MKAKVKHNNEIIDVIQVGTKTHLYDLNNVEIINDPDYWTRLEHQYAGMAMQGILTNPIGFENIRARGTNIQIETALLASEFAHALVQKIKEERK